MGVAAAIRNDVIYLDNQLVRFEANPADGTVTWFVNAHEDQWQRAGVIDCTGTAEQPVFIDWANLPIKVTHELATWLGRGSNRDRMLQSADAYLTAIGAR
jgi:hypothetical protein